VSYLSALGDAIGVQFDTTARLTGQLAWDVAKTSQIAFENVFMSMMADLFKQYPNIPVVLVGGCALNILLNTRLQKELNRDVFVPPNPNDCGLAVGMILNHMKPESAIDVTYAGIDILDKHTLMSHVEDRWAEPLDMSKLLTDLKGGKIVGVVRGTCEHGPRALGNRSIICNPAYPLMKDILNAKVKNREWYRPFAPVCRLQDAEKYFDMNWESRWMGFCPIVRPEWREQLVSITHVDGTARVQTVTREQNPWLYDLLCEFEAQTGVGVLLNTSFNVNGKPILSRYSDALAVYDKTQMDCLVLGDYYFRKP
jgi:carbamoyltransferase